MTVIGTPYRHSMNPGTSASPRPVEVTSPGDTRREVADKVASWLAAGTRLVWVVDVRRATVTIHEPDGTPRRLAGSDALDGEPLLPGFRLPVTDIFGFAP